jgi:hypothetical protein
MVMRHVQTASTLGYAVRSTVIAAWLYLRKNCETQLSGILARFYNPRRFNGPAHSARHSVGKQPLDIIAPSALREMMRAGEL